MYNDVIVKNFSSPGYSGSLEDPACTLQLGNSVCGDRMEVDIRFADKRISDTRFRAWGCATSIATANIFCDFIKGKDLTALDQVKDRQIMSLLGEIEPSQYHCLEMLHSLFAQVRAQR